MATCSISGHEKNNQSPYRLGVRNRAEIIYLTHSRVVENNLQMAQKNLTKSRKFSIIQASKRQNIPTQQNLKNKANVSHRAMHKSSASLGKIIETEVASQVGGASGLLGQGGALSVVKVDKRILGRIVSKKGGKAKGSALKK